MKIEACVLCGIETSHIAGNPSVWPMYFPALDGTGVAKCHCTGCVINIVYKKYPNLLAENDILKKKDQMWMQELIEIKKMMGWKW